MRPVCARSTPTKEPRYLRSARGGGRRICAPATECARGRSMGGPMSRPLVSTRAAVNGEHRNRAEPHQLFGDAAQECVL